MNNFWGQNSKEFEDFSSSIFHMVIFDEVDDDEENLCNKLNQVIGDDNFEYFRFSKLFRIKLEGFIWHRRQRIESNGTFNEYETFANYAMLRWKRFSKSL